MRIPWHLLKDTCTVVRDEWVTGATGATSSTSSSTPYAGLACRMQSDSAAQAFRDQQLTGERIVTLFLPFATLAGTAVAIRPSDKITVTLANGQSAKLEALGPTVNEADMDCLLTVACKEKPHE